METAYIDPELAEELHESEDGDTVLRWTRVTDIRGEARRWMERHTLVIKDADDRFWGLDYEVGLTEEQPNEYPWRGTGDEPLALTRLYPHTVTTTDYRTKPPADPLIQRPGVAAALVAAIPDDALGTSPQAEWYRDAHGLDPGQVC